MTANKTNRDRYFCRSCGGVTVYLDAKEAAAERRAGHDIELWSEIEKKNKQPTSP